MDFQENENNIQELLSIFQVESEEILEKIFDNLLSFESNPTDKELCATLYRELHSLKGAVRMVGFNNIQNIYFFYIIIIIFIITTKHEVVGLI